MTDPRVSNTTRAKWSYPSPWLDVASTWLPSSFRELFKWCRFYYYSNSYINNVLTKLALYVLTDFKYNYGDTNVKESEKKRVKKIIRKHLKLKQFMINSYLDLFAYGNCYISFYVPFKRTFKCPLCEKDYHDQSVDYKVEQFTFKFKCPDCDQVVKATVKESKVYRWQDMNLVRWNPENIIVEYNHISGRSKYFYKIPAKIKADINSNKKYVIEETPLIFIEALRKNRDLELHNENLFHFMRPSLAEDDMGVGKSVIVPVMKDIYYYSIMQKAQEAVMLEHIVPFDLIFPQAHSGVDPFTHMNLKHLKSWMEEEIRKWRRDNNHKSILPFPMGTARIGGDGRALLITPELQQQAQKIVGGTGVPYDLVYGNLVYSGGSVTQRILENFIIGVRDDTYDFFDWLTEKLSKVAKTPASLELRMVDFKMADDVQRKQLAMQGVQMKLLSKETASKEMGWNYDEEKKKIAKENKEDSDNMTSTAKDNATAQGEASLVGLKYQMKAQEMQIKDQEQKDRKAGLSQNTAGMGPMGGMGGNPLGSPPTPEQSAEMGAMQQQATPPGVDWAKTAEDHAAKILQMPPQDQEKILQQISAETPELYKLVIDAMTLLQQGQAPMGDTGGGASAPTENPVRPPKQG